MNHDQLDRALSAEDGIEPSSGFGVSVMDAVRREASAPPPIPFPWRRAGFGFGAAALTLAGGLTVLLARSGSDAGGNVSSAARAVALESLFRAATDAGAHWIALACLLTLASVVLSMRLSAGRT